MCEAIEEIFADRIEAKYEAKIEMLTKRADEAEAEGQSLTAELFHWLFTNNRTNDAVRASADRDYLAQLLSEYQTAETKGVL